MEYLIPLLLVLVLVGGFVTFLVVNATRRGQSATRRGDKDGPPGIGRDETPLGDTAQHAGQQTEGGETVGGQDASRSGGTGRPAAGYESTTAPPAHEDAGHTRRSGEGEGTERLDFPTVTPPAAERIAAERRPGAQAAGSGEQVARTPDEHEEPEPQRPRREGEDTAPASERLADREF